MIAFDDAAHQRPGRADPPHAASLDEGDAGTARATSGSADGEASERVAYVDVLDSAEEMAFVTLDLVATVARSLAFAGRMLLIRYDREREQLAFYCVEPRLPCGRDAAPSHA